MLWRHDEKNASVRQPPFLEFDDVDVAYDHSEDVVPEEVFQNGFQIQAEDRSVDVCNTKQKQ